MTIDQTKDIKELRKSFIQTIYQTLDGVISPTPYMEIKKGDTVDVKFLNGQGKLPTPNTTEVTILDIDAASLFFDDFHILYEGVTGVGKTYTSDALFGAIFGPEGQTTLRLGGSGVMMGTSALEPFTKTVLEHGIPKTRIDLDKCSKYGALFIDEINRGDSQEVLQVVDGIIDINGERGYLRLPIPETNPQRYKSLAIIAAMNPADAEHKQALELDIAGENRFLKFRFPNGVAEAASSQLEKKVVENLHEKFWVTFNQKTGVKGTWKDIYAKITDPEALRTELNGETREFIDVCLGYVGHDPMETYEHNAELIKQEGLQPHFSVRKDNDYNKVLESQHTLKHGFVRRDLRKISDLSRLVGFIKSIKEGTYEPKVDLNDVAVSIGIVLESKTITGSEYGKLMSLVNDARISYNEIRTQLNTPAEFGFRQGVWQSAVYSGQEKGFEAYLNTINQNITAINSQNRGPAQATIKSRLMADLVVLRHFSKTYESEISKILNEKDETAFALFTELYDAKKSNASIYEHRLGSIMR